MSGIEVAGLLLAIPAAVSGFRATQRRLRTYRKLTPDVAVIETTLKVQRGIFLNECVIFLELVVSPGEARGMMEDVSHPTWRDNSIEHQLNITLSGANAGLFKLLLNEVHELLKQIDDQLKCFGEAEADKSPEAAIQRAFRRASQPVRFQFRKARCEELLEQLRKQFWNLNHLREQVTAFQRQDCGFCSRRPAPKTFPAEFKAIQRSSASLYTAFKRSFCCVNKPRINHSLHLGIDVTAIRPQIKMKLGLVRDTVSKAKEPPLLLSVESVPTPTPESGLPTPGSSHDSKDSDETTTYTDDDETLEQKRTSGSTNMTRSLSRARNKPVKWSSGASKRRSSISVQSSNHLTDTPITPLMDVAYRYHVTQICEIGNKYSRACRDSQGWTCAFEPLQAPGEVFYFSFTHDARGLERCSHRRAENVNVNEYLKHELGDVFTVVHQLNLALMLAKCILQYHATPWLRNDWNLSDILLHNPTMDSGQDSLLFVTAPLRGKDSQATTTEDSQDIRTDIPARTSEDLYGISNMTLFSLGMALLQVGRWKPISILRHNSDPNDIVTARREASRGTRLGPLYQKIVQKCLRCDFGVGNNLDSTELLSAVYGEVVCPINKLIDDLSGLTQNLLSV